MDLPSLRTLHWGDHDAPMEHFLRAHGNKLTNIIVSYDALDWLNINVFEVCPNLSSITIPLDTVTTVQKKSNPLNPKHFSSPKTAACVLEKIRFQTSYWSGKNKDNIAAWDTAFAEFQPQFPNLQEIRMDPCAWPTNERDIGKSYWVRWAGILLNHNINLVDKDGKKWRPRLKV
ncbi:hypothetical protein C8R46DRAFT_463493 [Mycena filopes]|nr:hypothetical protein C8R46DRAFT_463493 [Mycena filopes]